MIDVKICEWLSDNADAPIRYRVARELLRDNRATKDIEKELIDNPVIALWLKNLKPESPPQHHWMVHGSFNFCLENAVLKAIQLGLHAELPQVSDAIAYYIDKIESVPIKKPVRNCDFRTGFDHILISNLLTLAGADSEAIRIFMRNSLDEMYCFVRKGDYNIYYTEDERAKTKGIPKIWRSRQIIKQSLLNEYGFCYPLLYDVVGLHMLYGLNDQEVTGKIDAVIDYISTDTFHNMIADGYGIMSLDNKKYYANGWDPKYPGWYDAEEYLKTQHAPYLLFFAQIITKYPAARKTKWYNDLLSCLEKYRTDSGTYLFPPGWLKESQGYAVMGSHLSFGENRRKKNWREIESTFYVQLLNNNL